MSFFDFLLITPILVIVSIWIINWINHKRSHAKYRAQEDDTQRKFESVKSAVCGKYGKNVLCCENFGRAPRRFYVLTGDDLIIGTPSGYQTIHYSNIKRAILKMSDQEYNYDYIVELWTDNIAQPIEMVVFSDKNEARTFLARFYAAAKWV